MADETHAPDESATDEGAPPEDGTPEASDSADLGEAGQKALKSERRARAAAEREAKALKAQLDEIHAANMSEQEKAIAAAREEARTEVLSTANARLLRAEVKALAGGKLADPGDAVRLLDLDTFQVSDDGDVDTEAISTAIEELVRDKPYLAADPAARPTPLPGGGARPPAKGSAMNTAIRQAAGR